jgi:fructosamine-3-kinase
MYLKQLRSCFGEDVVVNNTQALSGGDINEVLRLSTSHGEFCVKRNSASRFPAMFEREASGLELLRTNSRFTLPKVIASGEEGQTSFLIMEFINSGNKAPGFWDDFGRKLAAMHEHTNDSFGLDEENYIGSLSQSNKQHSDWGSFYAEERLIPQLVLARDKQLLDAATLKKAERLCSRLNEYFPKEPSALLHGDLWSGNYMVDANGDPALIDPAVYYGHREMDLGMTLLFGGFDRKMYAAYNELYPLESDWRGRVELCQLYPVLVHVNLFGSSYARQAESIISKFS